MFFGLKQLTTKLNQNKWGNDISWVGWESLPDSSNGTVSEPWIKIQREALLGPRILGYSSNHAQS